MAALTLAVVFIGVLQLLAEEARPGVGSSLVAGPPIFVESLAGKRVDLREGIALKSSGVGDSTATPRVTLIVFWATWCAPCVHEIPVLNELHRFYGSRGLRIVGVGLDIGGETRENLAQAAAEYKIAYPTLFDAHGEARDRFDLSSVPAAVLVDSGGQILWIGQSLPPDLSTRIRTALSLDGDGAAK